MCILIEEFPSLPHGFLHFGLLSPGAATAVSRIGYWLTSVVNPDKASQENVRRAEREAELDTVADVDIEHGDDLVIRAGHVETSISRPADVPPSIADPRPPSISPRSSPSLRDSLLHSWKAVKGIFTTGTAEFP